MISNWKHWISRNILRWKTQGTKCRIACAQMSGRRHCRFCLAFNRFLVEMHHFNRHSGLDPGEPRATRLRGRLELERGHEPLTASYNHGKNVVHSGGMSWPSLK